MEKSVGHSPRDSATCIADVTFSPSSDKNTFRTVWISDLHLGTPRCKAVSLRKFLRSVQAETLYLLGDVIDGWNMGPGWCWTPEQTAVVEEIWAWRRRGSRIVFIPGNHDECNGELVRTLFGSIECHPHVIHRTAEGRRMLVIHGHQFDAPYNGSRWLSALGSIGYSNALKVNVWYNRVRGRDVEAIGARLRLRLKTMVHQLIDFSDARVCDGVRQHRADGVICGHTHKPAHRMMGPILYVNDGDWVQSKTALIEDYDGALNLMHWPQDLDPQRETG